MVLERWDVIIFMSENKENVVYIILEYYYDYFVNKLWIEDKSPRFLYAISKYAIDHKTNKWVGITKEDKMNFIEWARSTSPRRVTEKVSKILNNC